jgi:hypothetical protein
MKIPFRRKEGSDWYIQIQLSCEKFVSNGPVKHIPLYFIGQMLTYNIPWIDEIKL